MPPEQNIPTETPQINNKPKSIRILRGLMWLGVIAVLLTFAIAFYGSYQKKSVEQEMLNEPIPGYEMTVENCINSTDTIWKRGCSVHFAVSQHDGSFCRKVFGESDEAYYCEARYTELTHELYPTNITLCQSMLNATDNQRFYKDLCFKTVAIVKSDKDICKNITDIDERDDCVRQILTSTTNSK